MTFRDWWERYIWPPRTVPLGASLFVELAALVDKRSTEYGAALERQIAWLQSRNAELTQALLAKPQAPVPVSQPEPTTVMLPAEVVKALTDRMGLRWMDTNAGRNAAMWASMALATMDVEQVAKKIYDGEDSWS